MKRKIVAPLVLAFLPLQLAAMEAPATPQVTTPGPLEVRAREVLGVLRGEVPAGQVFSEAFLAAVPPAQLKALMAQLTSQFGAFQGIETIEPAGPNDAKLSLRLERAIAKGSITLDAQGRVAGFLIDQIEPVNDSVAAITADLAALPGAVNAWFGPLDGGTPRLAIAPERSLALGSTFKLFVLAALDRAVAAGTHRWDGVVPLSVKSYPSGLAQGWPKGAPVTLHSLATLMLQISDNTATDQLMQVLGRESVEAEFRATGGEATPTLPFLTTREMFVIKTDPALRARYSAADERSRRTLLATLPARDPPLESVAAAFSGAPMAIDSIEWFASPQSLARLLARFARPESQAARSILGAAKGMDAKSAAKWSYVGFKGGSEPGVINLTWLLEDRAGRWHMLTLGWNNPSGPVEEARLTGLATRIVALAD